MNIETQLLESWKIQPSRIFSKIWITEFANITHILNDTMNSMLIKHHNKKIRIFTWWFLVFIALSETSFLKRKTRAIKLFSIKIGPIKYHRWYNHNNLMFFWFSFSFLVSFLGATCRHIVNRTPKTEYSNGRLKGKWYLDTYTTTIPTSSVHCLYYMKKKTYIAASENTFRIEVMANTIRCKRSSWWRNSVAWLGSWTVIIAERKQIIG